MPTVDIKTYEIELEIEGRSEAIRLTMDDLKQFPEHTVTATVMCGGNRRSEMTQVKPVKGLNWGQSAVGNAEWTGVRLRDVLERHGIKSDETSHVHFEGLDRDPTYTPYAASIPLSMVGKYIEMLIITIYIIAKYLRISSTVLPSPRRR